MFDFKKFLQDYNIPIPQGSRNTGQGWINIQCPFCENDKTNHLGFNYEKGYFHCWKCSENSSGFHSIESVIEKLLPYENTKNIIKKYDTDIIYNNKIHEKLNKTNTNITLPGDNLKGIHRQYLIKRKFNPDYLIKKYNIKGTTHIGNYRYRIIIPVYYNNQLVTFQTRAINKNETRYINCDPAKEIIPIKHTVYNLDNCTKNYCVLTEGCFKVFRLGNNSCATLGKNYSIQQLNILVKNFKKIYVFFDPDSPGQAKAKKIAEELISLGLDVYNIENDLPPDEMSQKDADNFMKQIG